MSAVIFRFCQILDPLVIIEHRSCKFFFLQKHQKETTYFWEISVAHLAVRTSRTLNIRLLCPAPANAMIAFRCSFSFARRLRSTHGRQCDMRERRDTRLVASSLSHGTTGFLVPASSPSCTCCLSSLCFCGGVYLCLTFEESKLWSTALCVQLCLSQLSPRVLSWLC